MTVHSVKLAIASATDRLRHARRRPKATLARLAGHAWFLARAGRKVESGPFAGMRFPLLWPHLPCIIGTYERELDCVWREIIGHGFKQFVDVGAADGYYAVGMAKVAPGVVVDAFEVSEGRRLRIARVARANGVQDRVRVHGFCDAPSLRPVLADAHLHPTVMLVDIDGGERELMQPQNVPELANVHILIEIHEDNGPRISERFAASHAIAKIQAVPRVIGDMPHPGLLGRIPRMAPFALSVMDERRRDGFEWFWMIPR